VDQASGISQRILTNGMPLVQMPMSGRLATTIAIAFPAGSRHEQAHEVGVAHLLEHLVFKGAEKYPTARDLNRAAGYLGTELEGVTTHDYVEFSAVVRAESAMATVDLLSDVSGRALLDEAYLQAERAVVLQEIAEEYEDPGARADYRLMAALFCGHRLAVDIAGQAADVQRLTYDRVLGFRERQWSPEAGVVVIAGNLEHLDCKELDELLLRIAHRSMPPPPAPIGGFVRRIEVEELDNDVVHLRLAYDVPGLDLSRRQDRAVAEVYSNMLGGPMGSRLFDELREQHSLCYWIDGFLWGHESASFLSVQCSVHPSDLAETYERIEAIISDLRESGPTEEETLRARSYASGSAALSFESTSARADHAVELILEYDDHDVDPMLHLSALESVTHKELEQLAGSVKPGPCVGCVGPVSSSDFQ
jgi:predicted Zn-dependent peptidase